MVGEPVAGSQPGILNSMVQAPQVESKLEQNYQRLLETHVKLKKEEESE